MQVTKLLSKLLQNIFSKPDKHQCLNNVLPIYSIATESGIEAIFQTQTSPNYQPTSIDNSWTNYREEVDGLIFWWVIFGNYLRKHGVIGRFLSDIKLFPMPTQYLPNDLKIFGKTTQVT